jgi:hypothetical protein
VLIAFGHRLLTSFRALSLVVWVSKIRDELPIGSALDDLKRSGSVDRDHRWHHQVGGVDVLMDFRDSQELCHSAYNDGSIDSRASILDGRPQQVFERSSGSRSLPSAAATDRLWQCYSAPREHVPGWARLCKA